MNISGDNLFMQGVNGSSKNMTITKRQSGKYVMHGRRGKNSKGLSTAQLAVKEKFVLASFYANGAMENPEVKAMYQAEVRPDFTAYSLAAADALRIPKVHSIKIDGYTGAAGQPILVVATDDFKVVEVKVFIHNAAGEIIESGNAVVQMNTSEWLYSTTTANAQFEGSRITAIAVDMPKNEGSLEVLMS